MSEAGEIRAVQVGRPFAIDLEAIPGAGYMWELSPSAPQIELISQDVVKISKAIGGNSTQRFQLVAKKPGTFTLEFQLKRRWEAQPARTSRITIRAE